MATDNDLEVDVAMDNTMKEDGKCVETSSLLFQETWAMVDANISVGRERAITDTRTKLRPKRRKVAARKRRSNLTHTMKRSNKAQWCTKTAKQTK